MTFPLIHSCGRRNDVRGSPALCRSLCRGGGVSGPPAPVPHMRDCSQADSPGRRRQTAVPITISLLTRYGKRRMAGGGKREKTPETGAMPRYRPLDMCARRECSSRPTGPLGLRETREVLEMPITHANQSLFSRIGTVFVSVLLAAPAAAESGESETQDRIIEEIIVTAEKREENILKVPMSMTALNDTKIEELGIQNFMDLEQLVPGLQFGDPNGGDGHGTTMRGMGTARGGSNAGIDISRDEAVATYVDGVFTIADYGLHAHLFDLERVEVLRGPQGTMRGRNAIAGAISYYTKKPTDEWDALVIAEVTDQMTQRVNVAFGGPLSDYFSFRITGGYFVGDGAQENIGFGGDYDEPDQRSFSPQLRFKTNRLDINLRYGYVEDTGAPRTPISISDRVRDVECAEFPGLTYAYQVDGCEQNNWYLYEGSVPSIDADCPPNVPGFKCGKLKNITNVNAPGIQDSHRETVIAYAMFDLTETLTLRYNFGLADILQSSSRDNDNTNRVSSAQDVSLASDGLVPFINDRQENFFPYEETSHELQLLSNFDGPFNFVSGVFYYDVENAWDMEIDSFSTTFRFLNADEAAQAVGFGGCQEMLELFG
ncbi:MAG: TonB-dependent receptor plug domain-containing protein, partial [Gammaproteobacteria bacterium]|nr:TonB-dependent receptor plug domain-containing protein [Gammaproteobacteria bacterium]